jgi:hypothetical protein
MHRPRSYVVSGLVTVAAVGVLAFAFAGTATAAGGPSKFKTTLDSFHETPSIVSGGTGTFEGQIDKAGDMISYTLTFSGLTSNTTQSHIHIGQPGVAGGVSMFLCTNLGNGPAGTPACPATGGRVSGTLTAANVVGPAAQNVGAGDFAKVIEAMRTGATYVNVHSTNFPAGEIRGQLGKFK